MVIMKRKYGTANGYYLLLKYGNKVYSTVPSSNDIYQYNYSNLNDQIEVIKAIKEAKGNTEHLINLFKIIIGN